MPRRNERLSRRESKRGSFGLLLPKFKNLAAASVSESRPRIARIVFSDCSGSLSSIHLLETPNLLASGLKTISGQRNARTDLGTDEAHKRVPRVDVPSFGFSGVYSPKRLGYRVGFVSDFDAPTRAAIFGCTTQTAREFEPPSCHFR